MSEIFQAADLKGALDLAKQFKVSGKYNLFRGQAQDWPVMSSLGRLLPEPDPEIQKQLERLFLYFDSSSALRKYKADIDWFWAVAQHYGLKTNYIDFTESPEVATYFATNSHDNLPGENAVIICLNEADWNSFISSLKGYFEEEKVIAPYIARIDVDNLWRLQAQQGCFMFTPYSQIEFFYDFDRIIFPFSEPYSAIRSGHIYPKRKSELEQLLDHYFNMEERIKGAERMRKFAEEINMPVSHIGGLEFDHYFKRKQKHTSWRSAEFKTWDLPLMERWAPGNRIRLQLNYVRDLPAAVQLETIRQQLAHVFRKRKISRITPIKFYLDPIPDIAAKDIKLIQRCCSRAWDGMRNLPFSDAEIIQIISQVVVAGVTEALTDQVLSFSGEKLLLLEMTNEYGNTSRCQVSPSVIISCFRADLFDILSDEAPRVLQPEMLLHINDPYLLFDFHLLLAAFKKEIIHSQLLLQQENEHPVIFFTPAQINVLGYA
ncbi:FRG domain-containing protein [Mucilaginibacter sp. 3215]|uniref:FRG domain-containing protein n=1 Tax=Mucilaginibacter sp. 3215 TaxID=3373912 RepID=UPI003D1A00E7